MNKRSGGGRQEEWGREIGGVGKGTRRSGGGEQEVGGGRQEDRGWGKGGNHLKKQ